MAGNRWDPALRRWTGTRPSRDSPAEFRQADRFGALVRREGEGPGKSAHWRVPAQAGLTAAVPLVVDRRAVADRKVVVDRRAVADWAAVDRTAVVDRAVVDRRVVV